MQLNLCPAKITGSTKIKADFHSFLIFLISENAVDNNPLRMFSKHKKKAMKKRFLCIVMGGFSLLTVVACNQSYEHSTADTAMSLESADTSPATAKSLEDQQTTQRKIIKEGSIRFETANAKDTRQQITTAVGKYKGYVSQDNAESYGNRSVYTLTLRIPAEHFENLLTDIGTTAKNIEQQDIKALDVTEEFIDVASRIQTKKELENRYKALLGKATKIEEILSIEKEIETLRSDIESFEGRLNYLKSSIAYSTLTVVFYETQPSTQSFGSDFTSAFKEGWNNLVSFTLGLFYIWPFILISLGIFFLIRRRIKRKKTKTNESL